MPGQNGFQYGYTDMESLLIECESYGVDIGSVIRGTPCSEEEAFGLRIERLLHLKKLEFYEFAGQAKDEEMLEVRTELMQVKQALMQVKIELQFWKKNGGRTAKGGGGEGNRAPSSDLVITSVWGKGNGGNQLELLTPDAESLMKNGNSHVTADTTLSTGDSFQVPNPAVASFREVQNKKDGDHDFVLEDCASICVKMEASSDTGDEIIATPGLRPSTSAKAPLNDESNSEDDNISNSSDDEYLPDDLEDSDSEDEGVPSGAVPDNKPQSPANNASTSPHCSEVNQIQQLCNEPKPITHPDNDQKPFKCQQCSKRFIHKKSLTRHIEVTHSGINYKCRFCPRTFARVDYRKVHERLHVNGTPEIVQPSCRFCNKAFETHRSLNAHIKFNHPYESLKAEVGSNQGGVIKKSRSGSGKTKGAARVSIKDRARITPWKCSYCGLLLTKKYSLDVHVLRFHSEGKGKKFKCHLCSKGYVKMSDLNYHKKCIHKCRFCDEMLPDSSQRDDHEKIHVSVKQNPGNLSLLTDQL